MIRIKAGDTAPAVNATLFDAAGEPVDLNGASVRFVAAVNNDSHAVLVDSAATLVQVASGTDGSKGMVRYDWAAGDTTTAEECVAEFEVTYSDGTVQTFPTEGYIPMTIEDDLGGDV